jgi:hypothetical protein
VTIISQIQYVRPYIVELVAQILVGKIYAHTMFGIVAMIA